MGRRRTYHKFVSWSSRRTCTEAIWGLVEVKLASKPVVKLTTNVVDGIEAVEIVKSFEMEWDLLWRARFTEALVKKIASACDTQASTSGARLGAGAPRNSGQYVHNSGPRPG